jgi:hypothetical protein
MLDNIGNYSLQIMRSDWLPFARARMEGAPEENKTVVQSMISHFGTYTVDEPNHSLVFHITGSSYPNWEKSDQVRPIVIALDQLTWPDPRPATGPQSTDLRSDLIWRRVKSN